MDKCLCNMQYWQCMHTKHVPYKVNYHNQIQNVCVCVLSLNGIKLSNHNNLHHALKFTEWNILQNNVNMSFIMELIISAWENVKKIDMKKVLCGTLSVLENG